MVQAPTRPNKKTKKDCTKPTNTIRITHDNTLPCRNVQDTGLYCTPYKPINEPRGPYRPTKIKHNRSMIHDCSTPCRTVNDCNRSFRTMQGHLGPYRTLPDHRSSHKSTKDFKKPNKVSLLPSVCENTLNQAAYATKSFILGFIAGFLSPKSFF